MGAPSKKAAVDLDVKIGQMLMIGFRGMDVDENSPIIEDIAERHIGGVILFDEDIGNKRGPRNVESAEQLQRLTGKLQSASALPLLVAIDQEGGRVARLKEKYGFPPTASAGFLGSRNDLTLTHTSAGEIAETLFAGGINLNLAPVVDLNANRTSPAIGALARTFSSEPDIVVNHAQEFVRAHHEKGVLTALKHFPGHGSAKGDSHEGLTDVTSTWSSAELLPYERLIKSNVVDAVMTAHVFNKNIDPLVPATLSKAAIGGILRKQLGFNGVVITDDMQMGAIVANFGFETSIEKAIEAGVDIILIANNLVYDKNAGETAFRVIKNLVLSGKISESRIDESYDRIVKLKSKIGKPLCGEGVFSETTRDCMCTPPPDQSEAKIKECINTFLYKPDTTQTEKALLTIVIKKDKAKKFDFMEGFTKLDAVGSWREIGPGGKVIREYPNEVNVQYDVEFSDRTDGTVHRGLLKLLKEFNRRVVGESLLYTRIMPVSESSL